MKNYSLIIFLGISYILCGLFFWIFKGFKTSIESELGDKYIKRNLFFGIIFLSIGYFLFESELFESKKTKNEEPIKYNINMVGDKYIISSENGDTIFDFKKH